MTKPIEVLNAVNTALGHRRRVVEVVTPTGQLALVRTIAERLLKEGVISGSLDGVLHANDAATVKAAIMASAVCDFCSAQGAVHFYDVLDFGTPGGVSTGGWLACDECDQLIKVENRKGLVARSRNSLAFPKFTDRAVEELHEKFWKGLEELNLAHGAAAAVVDYIEDRIPNTTATITDRDRRREAVAKFIGLTDDDFAEISRGTLSQEVVRKLSDFERTRGKVKNLSTTIDKLIEAPRKPLADIVPHWQRALDMKFVVAAKLGKMLEDTSRALTLRDAIDLNDQDSVRRVTQLAQAHNQLRDMGFEEDVKYLRAAQAYSFNAETIAAIREASGGIPHDAPLSSIETPNTGAGWFWFAEPLPIATSPILSENVNALLWGWVSEPDHKEPALMFSAYVVHPGGIINNDISPSTRWYWPLSMTFHDMIAFNGGMWRTTYGEGAPLEHDPSVIGEKETLRCIGDLSLFFVMSCLWFKQRIPILTREPGHVERHARKRIQREHKLQEAPTVQVVALRKSQRTPVEQTPSDQQAIARQYNCRWIVQGHPRLQVCGPGRKDRKLIWIEAHPAGPEDKPFRQKTKVYAVVR